MSDTDTDARAAWRPVTVRLRTPIDAHGQTVSELTLAEPTLGVLDGVRIEIGTSGRVQIDLGDLHRLIAGMAGIPPSSARQIRMTDLAPLARAVMDFLPSSPPAGLDG